MLRPFIVKVSVLGYFPLHISVYYKALIIIEYETNFQSVNTFKNTNLSLL